MKRIGILLLIVVMIFALAACATEGVESATEDEGKHSVKPSYGGSPSGGKGYSDESGSKDYGGIVVDGDVSDVTGREEYAIDLEENGEIKAGQMTAKAQNDNDAYEEWKNLFNNASPNEPDGGRFAEYQNNDWAYDTMHRVKITVKNGEEPVFGAKVVYYDESQNKWISRTDKAGVAYLFPKSESGSVTVSSGESERVVAFSAEQKDLTVDLAESDGQINLIKIMFVIDATGSMGDEMRYITAELTDVVSRVAEQANQVRIDLALLFYRDDGDKEKFAYSDFVTVTTKEGLEEQLKVLKEQRAEGGDDYPEAADEAAVMAVEKDWGEENSTKLMFLVLDAPCHGEKENIARCASAVKTAAEKGIRICPILCSGADLWVEEGLPARITEYLTRMGALLTGGTMIFVTDDSGIGGEHVDPDLPDVTVEKMNDLLVRLIVGYHTGDFGTPKPYDEGETQDPGQTDPAPAEEPENGEKSVGEEE